MSKDYNELRERAENGELTDEDREYLNQRQGINAFDRVRSIADEPVFDEDDEDEDGYASLSVDALKDELKSRDLPVSGNKDELIARLEADDEDEDE